jgi:hypothetical protein
VAVGRLPRIARRFALTPARGRSGDLSDRLYRIVAFAPYNGPAMYWFPVAARKKRLSGHGLAVVFPRDAFYRDGKRALNDRGGESSRAPLLERPNS